MGLHIRPWWRGIAFACTLTIVGAGSASAQWSGPFVGAEMLGSLDSVDTTETTAATGATFHKFSSSGSGFGGGVNLGYNWQLPQNSVVLGVLASFDGLNDGAGKVFHTNDDYAGMIEARVGYLSNPVLLWYGETGLALAQENVKANLGGPTTSLSRTATGYALGGGVEWALPAHTLPIAAGTSLFFDYQHVWWDSGTMTTPAAAPNLDFQWQRESNIVRLGVRLHF
jgi:opacity protein-like surface antigen